MSVTTYKTSVLIKRRAPRFLEVLCPIPIALRLMVQVIGIGIVAVGQVDSYRSDSIRRCMLIIGDWPLYSGYAFARFALNTMFPDPQHTFSNGSMKTCLLICLLPANKESVDSRE
ncbi:hypothetical protein BT63DRAFT_477540 [Microthyrium microscopicum]|uniref:Uncharacterized protein n=1 Tax=Microthyrium microscopicum TaxID=703497 RepID=A0A6A6UHQ4_9PEZI|nr:hypothetical protein BT63DRAFT_477540 [Microthyrium microscopicum]